MTELQGWVAIIVGVITALAVVWRMSAGFSGLRADIRWMNTVNNGDHSRFHERLNNHSRTLSKVGQRISKLEGVSEKRN